MNKYYCRIIDMIEGNTVDYRGVGLALAKARPDIFVAIHDEINGDTTVDGVNKEKAAMNAAIRSMYSAGDKVAAIKHCRTVTGWGLKEAKDYCDALFASPTSAPKSASVLEKLNELLGSAPGDGGMKTEDDGTFR